MIEQCGDRQYKFDGLEKWPFHLFIESLPIMLQVSLLLLACGLCRHIWSINVSVAYILVILTVLGVLFYFGIVIAGTSSYECPFQTPASSTLCRLWKKVQPHAALLAHPIVTSLAYSFRVLSSEVLHPAWKNVTLPIISLTLRFRQAAVQVALKFCQWIHSVFVHQQHIHHPFPLVPLEETQHGLPVSLQSNPPTLNRSPSLHRANSLTHNTNSSNHNASQASHQETSSSSHDSCAYNPGVEPEVRPDRTDSTGARLYCEPMPEALNSDPKPRSQDPEIDRSSVALSHPSVTLYSCDHHSMHIYIYPVCTHE